MYETFVDVMRFELEQRLWTELHERKWRHDVISHVHALGD